MILSEKGKNIVVTHIGTTTCKYYRKRGERFDLGHLGPRGLCLDLYFVAYPYCLALLYGAEFSWMKEIDKNTVYAQCPAPEGNVHFKVIRKRLRKAITSRGVKKTSNIIIKICHVEKPKTKYENSCVCTQKVGQEYEFNQGDFLKQMCPAAFYSIYPIIKTILNCGKPPWGKNNKVYLQCPDNITKIKFKVAEKKQ